MRQLWIPALALLIGACAQDDEPTAAAEPSSSRIAIASARVLDGGPACFETPAHAGSSA